MDVKKEAYCQLLTYRKTPSTVHICSVSTHLTLELLPERCKGRRHNFRCHVYQTGATVSLTLAYKIPSDKGVVILVK